MFVLPGRSLVHLICSLDPDCPESCPVEKPDLCVRVKHSDEKGTFVLMSLCEFERVTCRQDVRTILVPLKFCFGTNIFEETIPTIIRPTRTRIMQNAEKGVKRNRRSIRNAQGRNSHMKYHASCPDSCPVRNVMVCARCMHGISRTFMSVCHVRMHHCRNPRDRIELVARRPCAWIGPYLGALPRPLEAVAEPGDLDPVLEHIYSDKSVENRQTLTGRTDYE